MEITEIVTEPISQLSVSSTYIQVHPSPFYQVSFASRCPWERRILNIQDYSEALKLVQYLSKSIGKDINADNPGHPIDSRAGESEEELFFFTVVYVDTNGAQREVILV